MEKLDHGKLIVGRQYIFSTDGCPEVTIEKSKYRLGPSLDPINATANTNLERGELIETTMNLNSGSGKLITSSLETIQDTTTGKSLDTGYNGVFITSDPEYEYEYRVKVPFTEKEETKSGKKITYYKDTCKIFSEDIPLAAAVGGRRRRTNHRTKRRSTRKRSTKRRKSLRH